MKKTLFCLLLASLTTWAQAPPPRDAAGCVESKVVSRMPGCAIMRCENKDFASASMPREQNDRTSQVEGQLERTVYRCPAGKSPLELGRNTEAALKNAGFQVFYTYVYGGGARFYMTAQKAPYWVNLIVMSDSYDLTIVKQKEMEQAMTANADGWAEQVKQTGKVSLYGINFDTAKATIRADSEPVLNEVAKMLQANVSWAMLVAGHTDNVGAGEMNMTLSRQRAESVIAWLASHGVDKARLVPAGFGDTRPVAPNTDDAGRQKNRRVDLVKVY
jgi:outer membrane protein OmpA-like peptidoglycan-associated protein